MNDKTFQTSWHFHSIVLNSNVRGAFGYFSNEYLFRKPFLLESATYAILIGTNVI